MSHILIENFLFQNQVGDIIQDLSATFPSRVLYDDQAYRNKQHPSRVLHKSRQRTGMCCLPEPDSRKSNLQCKRDDVWLELARKG